MERAFPAEGKVYSWTRPLKNRVTCKDTVMRD